MASRRVQSLFSAAVRAHYLMLLGLAGELSFPPVSCKLVVFGNGKQKAKFG